jgi:hypothetical protein
VCLERVDDGEDGVSTEVVDCDRPHDLEVVEVLEIDAFDEYPGDAEVTRWTFERCVERFEEYVGEPYGSSLLDLDVAVPDEGLWRDGDRTARCGVTNADGSRRDRSVRG